MQRILNVEQEVEWLYAFDIHCNGFFPMFVLLFVAQFFLAPLLLSPDFLATVLANTLYAAAFAYYHYITFLGYSGACVRLRARPSGPEPNGPARPGAQRCRSCKTRRSSFTRSA